MRESDIQQQVVNSRVCNIPIVQFAFLNNDSLARKLIFDFGADENIQTPESSNPEYVSYVAELFGHGRKEMMSINKAAEIGRQLSGIPLCNNAK